MRVRRGWRKFGEAARTRLEDRTNLNALPVPCPTQVLKMSFFREHVSNVWEIKGSVLGPLNGPFWGPFWDSFGTDLGTVLGQCWDSCWDFFGVVLGQFEE